MPPELTPGQLAERSGVAVSALHFYEREGLVESRPKIGTRVLPRSRWNLLDPDVLAWAFAAEPDIMFVRDLFELRAIVEPAAAVDRGHVDAGVTQPVGDGVGGGRDELDRSRHLAL